MSLRMTDSPNAFGLATSAGTSDAGFLTSSPASTTSEGMPHAFRACCIQSSPNRQNDLSKIDTPLTRIG